MTVYMSSHLTKEELIMSNEAVRRGIDNDPPPEVIEQLYRTAYELELVRKELGDKPLLISSGYRCLELNRLLGSKDTSQHVRGQAVDFTCPTFGTPREVVEQIVGSALDYDQCILEFGRWIHISFSDHNRRQALVIDKTGARAFA